MMWCFTQLCAGAEADSQESPARVEGCIQVELTLVSLNPSCNLSVTVDGGFMSNDRKSCESEPKLGIIYPITHFFKSQTCAIKT